MRFSIISGVLVAVARRLRPGPGPGETGAACVEAIRSILAGLFGVFMLGFGRPWKTD